MKEHSVSRIGLIRHPSPANTHQSLRAHDLITKRTATAKQPGNFNGAPLMQTRGWQLFLLPGTRRLEDCGEALRGPSASECYSFFIIYIILISSQRDFNTKKINPAAIPFSYFIFPSWHMFWFFDFFFSDSLHVARTRGGKLTFVSTRTATTRSARFPAETAFPFQKGRPRTAWIPPCPHRKALKCSVGSCNAPRHRCHSVGSRTEQDGGEAKTLLVQFIFWYLLRCKENKKKDHHLFLKSNWSFIGVHTSLIEPVNIYFFKYIYIFFANIRTRHQTYYHSTKYW